MVSSFYRETKIPLCQKERHRSFEFWDKPGKRLAYVLADDCETVHDTPMRGADGGFITDPWEKASSFDDYYSALYISDILEDQAVMKFIRPFCPPKCNQDHRQLLDAPSGVMKIINVIGLLKTNKAPSLDGLTSEFYFKKLSTN